MPIATCRRLQSEVLRWTAHVENHGVGRVKRTLDVRQIYQYVVVPVSDVIVSSRWCVARRVFPISSLVTPSCHSAIEDRGPRMTMEHQQPEEPGRRRAPTAIVGN